MGDIPIMKIYDIYGRILKEIPVRTSMTIIERNGIPEGISLFRIDCGGKILDSGKLCIITGD